MRIVVSALARADIKAALAWSRRHFDVEVARSYRALIAQAFDDLGEDLTLLRSQDELFEGCRLYHLAWSLQRARRVRAARLTGARHFLVCEVVEDTLHVLCLVHDAQDVPAVVRETLGR